MTTVSPSITHLTRAVTTSPGHGDGSAKREKKKTAAGAAGKDRLSARTAPALLFEMKLFNLPLEGAQLTLDLLTVELLL